MMTNGRRKPRRLLHTSDVHLELPEDRGCRSLRLLADLAIENDVDLVVIAGDFFDHNRVSDDLVRFVVDELQRIPADTIILPGNHDCLVPDSVYNRTHLWNSATSIHVLRDLAGETLQLSHLGVTVWGKPLRSYGDDVGPLEGMPPSSGDGQWHIAIAHGYFLGPQSRDWASFPITAEQIIESGRDYVALGDSHAFGCVSSEPVQAYYSGSPSSGSGGVAIVDLAESTGAAVACLTLNWDR